MTLLEIDSEVDSNFYNYNLLWNWLNYFIPAEICGAFSAVDYLMAVIKAMGFLE